MANITWNDSIYIPTLYKSISKNELKHFLEEKLGIVKRIDFVDLNEYSRQVFIHFDEWYTNKGFGEVARYQMEKFGFCNIRIPNVKNKKNPNFDAKIFINKNPLSESDSKIRHLHKIIDKCFERQYETAKQVYELENTIKFMNEKIDFLYENINEKKNSMNDENTEYGKESSDDGNFYNEDMYHYGYSNDKCILSNRKY